MKALPQDKANALKNTTGLGKTNWCQVSRGRRRGPRTNQKLNANRPKIEEELEALPKFLEMTEEEIVNWMNS